MEDSRLRGSVNSLSSANIRRKTLRFAKMECDHVARGLLQRNLTGPGLLPSREAAGGTSASIEPVGATSVSSAMSRTQEQSSEATKVLPYRNRRLIKFHGIAGRRGIFLLGVRPVWLFEVHGYPRLHRMPLDGEVSCFTAYHNVNVSEGFLYGNRKVSRCCYCFKETDVNEGIRSAL